MLSRTPLEVKTALKEPLVKRRATSGQEAGFYLSDNTPEGDIAADPGSICTDTVNGRIYLKQTGTGSSGWQELTLQQLIYTKTQIDTMLAALAPGLVQVGSAWLGANQTGNSRGANSLDVQTQRANITEVASGSTSLCVGAYNTASGSSSIAVGVGNGAGALSAIAVGRDNYAGYDGVSLGRGCVSTGFSSVAIGMRARSTTANVIEVGWWQSNTVRNGSIRMHGTGQVAFTAQSRGSAYTDGGTTAGSEADNTLGRGMAAIRWSGSALFIDYNNGGTIYTKEI